MSRNGQAAGRGLYIAGTVIFLAGMTTTVVIKGIARGPTFTWIAIPTLAGFLVLVVVLLLSPSRPYMRARESAAEIRSRRDSPFVIVALTFVDTRRAMKKLGHTSVSVPKFTPVSVSTGTLALWTERHGQLRPAAEIPAFSISSIEAGPYPAAGFSANAIWIHIHTPPTKFPLIVMDPSSTKRPKGLVDLDRLDDIAKTFRAELQAPNQPPEDRAPDFNMK
ncbi:hypothetical protein [Herbiconiux solani]|uniref:hypothetical protein n=1 Tax=Herbiconiux solani TaxID=661329 RepID=UPI000824C7F7|nr:hypothetical protein [Herbiconiux solani]